VTDFERHKIPVAAVNLSLKCRSLSTACDKKSLPNEKLMAGWLAAVNPTPAPDKSSFKHVSKSRSNTALA